MAVEYHICLTIRPDREEELVSLSRVHSRFVSRSPGRSAWLYDAQNRTLHHTVGGERTLLTRITNNYVSGRLLDIDQLGPDSLNVAIVVDKSELERLESDTDHFLISALISYPCI